MYLLFKICKIIFFLELIFFIALDYKRLYNDKISVIIPTYNRGQLLIRSLKSILNQTYKNIEVLIIDDGSKDDTKQKISNIHDNRIRYIQLRKNKGASFARNLGIKKSIGKYITFQDSDDISFYDKFKMQIENLLKHKSDLDFCKIRFYKFFNSSYSIIPYDYQHQMIIENKAFEALCYGNFISTCSMVVKKNIIEKYLFDNSFPRLQDYDLILRMMPDIKISYTNKILNELYIHKDSITNSNSRLKKAILLLLKKKYKMNFEQKKIFIENLENAIKKLNYSKTNN